MKRNFTQMDFEQYETAFNLRIESCISSFLKLYDITLDRLTRIEGEVYLNNRIEWKFVIDDSVKKHFNFKLPINSKETEYETLFLEYISTVYDSDNKIKIYQMDI